MKLVKRSITLLMALSMGAVMAAQGDAGSVSTDSSNPNTYGGSQDIPAYQMPNNDSGIELQNNSASTGTSSDSGSVNAPADSSASTDLNEATHSSHSSDQGANSADTGSAGSGYNNGFEGSK